MWSVWLEWVAVIAATSFFLFSFLPNLGNTWIICCFQHLLVSTASAEPCFRPSRLQSHIPLLSLRVMVMFLYRSAWRWPTLQCSKLILENDIFSPNTRNVSTWKSVSQESSSVGEQKKNCTSLERMCTPWFHKESRWSTISEPNSTGLMWLCGECWWVWIFSSNVKIQLTAYKIVNKMLRT